MQTKIFIKHPIVNAPANNVLLKESAEIVNKAIIENDPYCICLMLSGGDDSITALYVALRLQVKIDFIIHGVTGTGLPAVRKYVHSVAESVDIPILEANAGTAFEDYVMRKGFFGRGDDAHKFSYHVLKNGPFESTISKYITKRKRGRKIILLNGVRTEESENRSDKYGENPYTYRKNLIWVNIIHWYTKSHCLDFLLSENIKRNPVSIALNRSGECNCMTMQSMADYHAAAAYDPAWGQWFMQLRKKVVAKFGWDVYQQPNKQTIAEIKRKALTFSEYMPMCVGCKAQQKLFNI